jgi:hypothetical protein
MKKILDLLWDNNCHQIVNNFLFQIIVPNKNKLEDYNSNIKENYNNK